MIYQTAADIHIVQTNKILIMNKSIVGNHSSATWSRQIIINSLLIS